MLERHQIVAAAETFIGSPWVHTGRDKRIGVDCVGLVIGVGADLGLTFIGDRNHYQIVPNDVESEFLDFLIKNQFKPTDEIREGNLLLFKLGKARFPSHSAVIGSGGKTMIHAMNYRSRNGKLHRVVQHVYGQPWARRVHSIWEYPGVVN